VLVCGIPVAYASRERHHVALAVALGSNSPPLVFACAPAAVLAGELLELVLPLLFAPPPADPLADVAVALSLALPLGYPSDTYAPRIKAALRPADAALAPVDATSRRPAWKLSLFRGKPRLEVHIREELSAALYDRAAAPDTTQLMGFVTVRADLEGVPQVSLPLSYHPAALASPRNFVFDTAAALPGRAIATEAQTMITFVPPLGDWQMCSYLTTQLETTSFPVRAFYQMKELLPTEVKVLVQLKLHQNLPNNFEYFDVILPFAHRAQTLSSSLDATPTTGSIQVDKERRRIIWRIGTKVEFAMT
jgi:AP-5 complex subunit mu-1